MKIGIIGAGKVGGTLGRIWAQKGHDILFGLRDPRSSKAEALIDSTQGKARVGSIQEAAASGEVIAVATPWEATQLAIQNAGDLSGKILIDCTNPLGNSPESLAAGLTLGYATSAAEEVAKWATGARVVKAFNHIFFGHLENVKFGSVTETAFICGDDEDAKKAVASLARDIGFDVVDVGALSKARLIEPLAMLWINLAFFQKLGPDFAITLVKR